MSNDENSGLLFEDGPTDSITIAGKDYVVVKPPILQCIELLEFGYRRPKAAYYAAIGLSVFVFTKRFAAKAHAIDYDAFAEEVAADLLANVNPSHLVWITAGAELMASISASAITQFEVDTTAKK